MNYQKIYNQLIEKAQNRILPWNKYKEVHHILPRSMGGSNDIINLISLTAKEHFLAHLLLYKRYYLHIYASVLEHALKNTDQAKEEIILIDYGAGNGLLGLFAKFCGFKRVFINDHNKVFCEAVERLSIAIDVSPDNIIVGDIDAVVQFFLTEEQPTAIVGTDVIEHIYDLSYFFRIINKINSSIISVFTTASNPFNKYKVHQLKQLQYKDEYIGNSPEADPLFGEARMEAFIKIREDIIRKNFTSLHCYYFFFLFCQRQWLHHCRYY